MYAIRSYYAVPVSILKNQPKKTDDQSAIQVHPDVLENSIEMDTEWAEQTINVDKKQRSSHRGLLISVVRNNFV